MALASAGKLAAAVVYDALGAAIGPIPPMVFTVKEVVAPVICAALAAEPPGTPEEYDSRAPVELATQAVAVSTSKGVSALGDFTW